MSTRRHCGTLGDIKFDAEGSEGLLSLSFLSAHLSFEGDREMGVRGNGFGHFSASN